MSTPNDDFDLDALYQSGATESPSEAIDEGIIALAKQHLESEAQDLIQGTVQGKSQAANDAWISLLRIVPIAACMVFAIAIFFDINKDVGIDAQFDEQVSENQIREKRIREESETDLQDQMQGSKHDKQSAAFEASESMLLSEKPKPFAQKLAPQTSMPSIEIRQAKKLVQTAPSQQHAEEKTAIRHKKKAQKERLKSERKYSDSEGLSMPVFSDEEVTANDAGINEQALEKSELASSASSFTSRTTIPAPESELRSIRILIEEGDKERALELLKIFVKKYPEIELSDDLGELLGR